MGRVYWITGLSNSGKTTIGSMLYYRLKKSKNNIIILDGDLMKEIASGTEEARFSELDRMIRAKRYSQMAKLLADQGNWVIVCAIAMFDKVREWNRNNIKGYVEVFLDAPADVRRLRDKKGLYKEDDNVEIPKNPDLIFSNDGRESIEYIINTIIEYKPNNIEDYDRDKEYWNSYYASATVGVKPSDFARKIEIDLPRNAQILELGCGNGRDSLYFLSKGHDVTAVDGSDTAIDRLCELTGSEGRALFVCDNFVNCKVLYQMKYDCIYSRFTLHAITEEQENEMLKNAMGALTKNGFLCIEARTIHDEIYGKGLKVSDDSYIYDDHFRRFIDVDKFGKKLKHMGYRIISLEESKGFSKTEKSDPMLMRCIAGLYE